MFYFFMLVFIGFQNGYTKHCFKTLKINYEHNVIVIPAVFVKSFRKYSVQLQFNIDYIYKTNKV